MNIPHLRRSIYTSILSFSALIPCLPAADITWLGSTNNDWSVGSNWDNGTGPIQADNAFLNTGDTVDYDFENPENLRAIIQNGGVFNILGGELRATASSSATSIFNGIINHSAGLNEINRAFMGSANGTQGQYFLTGGQLTIARGLNGFSLYMGGLSSGTGSLTISGGSFITRNGVKLGDITQTSTGHFSVIGSKATDIEIGSGGIDGSWEQYDDSTLTVRIDGGGCTPILIKDNGNVNEVTYATFESGAVLDIGFLNNSSPGLGGTWTVMEVENGSITDNGLTLAPEVDTSIWSFNVDNSGINGILTVTALQSPTFSRDVTWDGSENSNWTEALNWSNNFGPFQNANAWINSGTINFTADSGSNYNLRALRMKGGNLNISGGTLRASALASGFSDIDGIVNHTDGTAQINAAEIGGEPANNAIYHLSGGTLTINRANNGTSLYLGTDRNNSDSGSGTLIISGGEFTTRTGVELGDSTSSGTGRFTVLGTGASQIIIGGANDDSDAFWEQNTGSILEFGINENGVTPIIIADSDSNTSGTSATFANGSLLDVDYHNITEGGGSWVVMEVENGPIIDQGLSFAPGVDTNIWSFTVDNSGSNGRLLISAAGDSLGEDIIIGSTHLQQMRYGMDYERLWFWTGGLNGSERDDIARWSAVDTDIDYIRVAINSEYELTEGNYDRSAYDDKILPLMREMRDANPNLKYFASPRPLNEAESGAAWQPYPRWITGTSSLGATDYNLNAANALKCAEYLERYILLMKDEGFKISFMDLTNEWDSSGRGAGAMSSADARDITEYLKANLDPADVPKFIASSAYSYAQGTSWTNGVLFARHRNAIDIAAAHNTGRDGNAAAYVAAVENRLNPGVEIWNTEVHGWKSTSNENETTSFYYYLEAVRAGFAGLNGWLAIGTTNQGHSYILNPNGTPVRNVKYYIFRKFSSTSNYGHALNIVEEPDDFVDTTNDYDSGNPRNIAAFIKGNLMTVWVINENPDPVSVNVVPSGHTIATNSVRRTHWIDPADVEGFETRWPVVSNSVSSTIPGESVCCFEITLGSEDFATRRIEAEEFSHQWGTTTETTGDVDGDINIARIDNENWLRYGSVALKENSILKFRLAQEPGRPSGSVRVREGNSEGPIIGQVAIPATGDWQAYETVETQLTNEAGIYNIYLEFVIDDGLANTDFVNFNWFSVNEASSTPEVTGITANPTSSTQIDLNWDNISGIDNYTVSRATNAHGPFSPVAANLTSTSYSDTGLTPGTEYFYVLSASLNGIPGLSSAAVSAITLMDAPLNLEASVTSPSSVTLSWDPSIGASTYTISRSSTSGGPYTAVQSSTSATTYLNTGLTSGTSYYYVVSALNSITQSPLSAEVGIIPYEPITPANLVTNAFSISGNNGSLALPQSGLGQRYQLWASETLGSDEWDKIGPVQLGTGGQLIFPFTYDPETYSKRFFRIEVSVGEASD